MRKLLRNSIENYRGQNSNEIVYVGPWMAVKSLKENSSNYQQFSRNNHKIQLAYSNLSKSIVIDYYLGSKLIVRTKYKTI